MAREPGVLLISPGIIKWTDMDFGLPHLVSMGGFVREKLGVRVELLDLNYEGGDHQHLLRTIESLGPHLVIGLSCYSSFDYMRVMALARFLRAHFPEVPLISGGYHASAMPGDVVFDGSPFDAVVVGEGELPLLEIVQTLLGGARLDKQQYGPAQIEELDTLPPYAWDLLGRYWPRALDLGRKFQIYLARGCPYHCTFCMERAKSGYKWRAYSAPRAVDELRRLAKITDLSHWVVNVADPLFGFKRSWRREVLEGIIRHELFPRQYWTLTRSDDLDDVDVELLARARFSIGIGLESGSPGMLTLMQKGNKPGAYLDAMRRLARLSRKHGLNWASNVIVGHPGETMRSMQETHAYLRELFTSAPETCGWLSIDPFRLYPGAQVHEAMQVYGELHGTRFHHPRWWTTWYDAPFLAEHIDPSREVDFETRVRFMYEAYGPLIDEIQRRFRGQGRSVDRVFARSVAEQARQMSPAMRDRVLHQGARALRRAQTSAQATQQAPALTFPVGLHVKDPWVRRRESAVRRLLDDGVLRTNDLIEALLQVAPERFMDEDDAEAMLVGELPAVEHEGELPVSLTLRAYALGLEALEPALGDQVADLTARGGYLPTVLARLVGEQGRVVALGACAGATAREGEAAPIGAIEWRDPAGASRFAIDGPFDGIWIGAAIPRVPASLASALRLPEGRAIAFIGPRFRAQDLVALTRREDGLHERRVARVQVPVLAGPGGWISAPATPLPQRAIP